MQEAGESRRILRLRGISTSVFLTSDDTSPVVEIAAPPFVRATFLEPIPLSLSPPQHELLRHCLASGLAHARDLFGGTAAASTEIHTHGVDTSSLYEFDADAPGRGPSGELIAGVMQRFDGPLCGTALFALDPGDALLWLQRGDDDGEPLERFVDWGARVVAGVVSTFAGVVHAPVELGTPVLEERPLMASLLGTHAPSDTVVVTLHGSLAFPVANVPELRAPFAVHVLLEPKRVAGILAQLEAGAAER